MIWQTTWERSCGRLSVIFYVNNWAKVKLNCVTNCRGEIHAAWHIRYSGRDLFVKCDERELLPIFTAEADQLELLSRSKTVTVPEVLAVGSDRDYSFLVMEYLPARPLDAHNAFILGQQIARLHQWSDQPQFGLDFDNDLSTTPQPNAGNVAGRPFCRAAYRLAA